MTGTRRLATHSGQPTEPGKNGVGQNAQRHGPHPADPVAEPAEKHPAGRRTDQESGSNDRDPPADLAFLGRAEEVAEGRTRNQGEQAHLQAIEHPAEQHRRERQPLPPRAERGDGTGEGIRGEYGGEGPTQDTGVGGGAKRERRQIYVHAVRPHSTSFPSCPTALVWLRSVTNGTCTGFGCVGDLVLILEAKRVIFLTVLDGSAEPFRLNPQQLAWPAFSPPGRQIEGEQGMALRLWKSGFVGHVGWRFWNNGTGRVVAAIGNRHSGRRQLSLHLWRNVDVELDPQAGIRSSSMTSPGSSPARTFNQLGSRSRR